MDELCRKINGEALCARASHLRGKPNVPCNVDLSPKNLSKMMGGQNCHADITFADGVVWMARFRLSGPGSPPPHVRDYVLRSEAATMKFLALHTTIPSPRVLDWALESDPDNAIGTGYILMEKLPGAPLDWPAATASQRSHVVRQLADIMIELHRHPFSQLGSLIDADTEDGLADPASKQSPAQIRGLAEPSTLNCGTNGGPLGPFRSSKVALRSLIESYIQMTVTGEIGTADQAIDVFLAHRFRLDVLDQVWPPDGTSNQDNQQFFLKHADDKGDHILVNTNFDIVGIIDWEWCGTASQEEAFASPCMMWPVGRFYDGSNELAEEEVQLAQVLRDKGRDDLARCVLQGRKVQRMLFALGLVGAAHQDKKTFASLFMGMKRAFGRDVDDGSEVLGNEEEEWKAWKADALWAWKDEAMLRAVLGSQ